MFYICQIYLGHSSVFISLQLLYQQQFSGKTYVVLQREKAGVNLSDIYVWRMLFLTWFLKDLRMCLGDMPIHLSQQQQATQ